MGTIHSAEHVEFNWLTDGPLAQHAASFKQYLIDGRYAPSTKAKYLGSVAHFARWARDEQLHASQISEAAVVDFLNRHIPRCRCSGTIRLGRPDLRAALSHLLGLLRARGVISPPAVGRTAVDEELRCYAHYLDQVRGLAAKTSSQLLRTVGRLLRQRFGDRAIDIAAIKPSHIRRFVAQQAALHNAPAGIGSVIAALRGYLRYRASLGDAVHGQLGAMTSPARWRLSTLPKTLSQEEVNQLIGSLSLPGRSTRRAAAIVRCALDLGLRSGEVAKLSLDDIDWRAGTITLRHTKGQRVDVLPLPMSTGAAIAAYLQEERPATSNRAVFVRHLAPLDKPAGPDLVRMTIRRAFTRAGLPYTSSHLLRHTMANRLLAAGSSLKEVADVLRHRSLTSTQVYAKLDSRRLVEVALPWPGSAS